MMKSALAVWCALLLAALAIAAPSAKADEPDTASKNVGLQYFGMHIHRADSGTAWPKARFGAWRLWDAYVAWPNLEPQRGRWDFTRLDRFVAFGERFGIDILLPLGLSPTWASARPGEKSGYQPGNAAEPADMDNWRRYVRTVAERYKGRVYNFDIWNEVNETGFYTGSMQKMVDLTCEAHKVLHEVSANNRVVSPSMIGVGTVPDRFEDFLRAGGKACIDVVGYHFYVPHREPEEIVALVQRLQQIMARQGVGDLPLWNTESGWWIENTDGSPETAADRRWRRVSNADGAAVVARSLILGRWAGLARFYWYAWDNGVLGLIEPTTGAIKPAGVAYDTLARWMKGAKPQCAVANEQWVCSLPAEGDAQLRRLAWRTGKNAGEFVVPGTERLLAVERLDGKRVEQAAGATPVLKTIALDGEPVLIVTTALRS